jgi:ABC-2 type transport system ATP-binding protein
VSDAIVIRGVTKTFGPKVAVDNIDLAVPRGSLCGFIGPNGAGKTTTLRMIMAIFFPDSGELTVLGRRSAIESKDRIGYLPEERGVYRKMKVGAFLGYMGRVKGYTGADLPRRINAWLERVKLLDCVDKKCEELSKGMQQKVQFIATVLHEPDLLILDEPFSGLDPVNMRLLRDLIDEQHQAGKTVLFSTHVMHQAEQICDRIVMIDEGHKVLDSTVEEIKSRFDPRTILVEVAQRNGAADLLRQIAGIAGVAATEGRFELSLDEGLDPQEAIRRVVAAVPVTRVELRRPTLEDVFVQIVQRDRGVDVANLRAALRDDSAGAGAS